MEGIGKTHTVFLPNADAIIALQDLMNLNQFDMLNIPDIADILEFHFIETRNRCCLEPGMAPVHEDLALAQEGTNHDHRWVQHHRHRFHARTTASFT